MTAGKTVLWRVTYRNVCAGVLVSDSKIVSAAPVLRWSVGKSLKFLQHWVKLKRGTVERVPGD